MKIVHLGPTVRRQSRPVPALALTPDSLAPACVRWVHRQDDDVVVMTMFEGSMSRSLSDALDTLVCRLWEQES